MSRNTQRLLLGRLFQMMLAIPLLLLFLYVAVVSYQSTSVAVQVGATVFSVLLLTVIFYTLYRHRAIRP